MSDTTAETPVTTTRLTREERAARLRARASRKAAEANQLLRKNDALLNCMAGSPVLVGHHSEGRHRRDLVKIDRDMRKSFDAANEAKELERRAQAAETNRAVSSDDADAIARLTEKRDRIEAEKERWKQINACFRRPHPEQALLDMGVAQITADKLVHGDFAGRTGIPAYAFTNASAEIRRLNKRIAELEAAATAPVKAPEHFGAVSVDEAGNRVRIAFPGKPAAAIIARLKSNGFRWAPSIGMWQRMANSIAWDRAREIATAAQ